MPIGINKVLRNSQIDYAIADTRVLQYQFEDDNDTSTATDAFNNNNDGSINNTTSFVQDSAFGKYALQIGSDGYVGVPVNVPQGDSSLNYTVACHFQTDTTSDKGSLVSQDNGGYDFAILVNDSSNGSIDLFGGSGQYVIKSGGFLSANTYYSLVVTFDNGTVYASVNGEDRVDTGADASDYDLTSNTGDLAIGGKNQSSNDKAFDGIVDQYTHYNKSLSNQEISNYHTTGSIN